MIQIHSKLRCFILLKLADEILLKCSFVVYPKTSTLGSVENNKTMILRCNEHSVCDEQFVCERINCKKFYIVL